MYQYSTINALMNGFYDGAETIRSIKSKGNFGLGTFNGLDGEMVILDGIVYKVKHTGEIVVADDDERSPFVNIVDFAHVTGSDSTRHFDSLPALEQYLENNLPSRNKIYAFRISCDFKSVKTRSIPMQSRPYVSFLEVTKTQRVFHFSNVRGTLIGFYFPSFMKDINLSGFHFHFLSEDRSKGGHLLDCSTGKTNIATISLDRYEIQLPSSPEFEKMNLEVDESDLHRAEKNTD